MTQIQKTILNNEITLLMETIREQFETLNKFEGKIPILEFEIIKDNVRKLYEKLYLLQRINDPFDLIRQKEQEIPISQSNDEPWVTESKEPEPIPSFIPPDLIKEEDDKPTEPEIIPVKTESSETEANDQPLKEGEESSETSAEAEKIDLFTSQPAAFNEKLREAREQSLGVRSKQTNPDDIKSLININDKFLFINELFDGDYKDYTRTIEIFNTMSDRGEAFEFLDTLLKDNLWNSTSVAFLKLKEIVEKRFS